MDGNSQCVRFEVFSACSRPLLTHQQIGRDQHGSLLSCQAAKHAASNVSSADIAAAQKAATAGLVKLTRTLFQEYFNCAQVALKRAGQTALSVARSQPFKPFVEDLRFASCLDFFFLFEIVIPGNFSSKVLLL